MRNKIHLFVITILISLFALSGNVYAAAPTDEIINYDIVVDVNDDATLTIKYHVDWEVLESDSAGALTWVQVGIPNSHTVSYTPLSDNISRMSITSSGGYFARIDFDRSYYKDDIASFDFEIVQDYMYQVDKLSEGETVYDFTPGWFDDIKVDTISIRWNSDKATEWSPFCAIEDGYCYWVSSLSAGERFSVSVTYPNDAFGFDLTKHVKEDEDNIFEVIGMLIGFVICIVFMIAPIVIIIVISRSISGYFNGANFGNTQKKITRTKVTYYPSCQGCGAVRKEGEQFCTYCGRSFVQSEEIIKEEDLKNNEREALKFKNDGEFRYSSSPNTYVRVHTSIVHVPVSRTTSSHTTHHSSCAHSSCACACACACAGGGRAGCTNKDFYNTDLKLRQLEKRIGKNHGR